MVWMWLLLAPGWGAAEDQVQEIAPQGVVLRATAGEIAQYTVPISIGALDEAPVLTLPWRTSDMVDLHASTLSVLLDDVPLATRRLEHLVQDGTPVPWELFLPERIATGQLQIRARLTIDDDPCLVKYPEEAWLVIHDGTLAWAGETLKGDAPPSVAPPAFPLAIADRTVRIDLDRVPGDPEWATGALHVWRMLRSYGAIPTVDEDADFIVGVRHAHLLDARAEADLRGNFLRLVAHGAEDLADLGVAMSDRGFLERCEAWPCLLGPGAPVVDEPAERDPLLAWALPDAGYFDGLTAEGPQEINIRAVPPAHWVRSEPPRVRMAFRRSGNLAADDSRLEALYNGVPFASVDLNESIPGMLHVIEAPLPRSAWNELGWSLTFRLDPVSRDQADCTRNAPAWISLDAGTGVVVPHRDRLTDGIASFADRMVEEMSPTIAWPPHPTSEEIAAVARILDGFDTPGIWTPTSFDRCEASCVRVRRDGPREIGLENRSWADASFGKVPVVAAEGRPLMHSDGVILDIHVVPMADATQMPIPRLLPGPWALSGKDGWSGFGAEDLPAVLAGTEQEVELDSDEAQSRSMLDLLFAVILVVVLMAGAGWIWRDSDAGEQEDFGLT